MSIQGSAQDARTTPAQPVQKQDKEAVGNSAVQRRDTGLRGLAFAEQEAALAPPPTDRPVQRKRSGDPTTDVHQAARHGTQGAGGALPHFAAIQRSFGAHDVSGVQAYTGGQAREVSSAMGASAYATGDKVAFANAPDLHTAAHEAAHVVQQKQGVSLSGGVGQVGDSYEQQADRVADAVVQGKSAEGLLGPAAGAGQGAGVQQRAVQHKKKFKRGTELSEHKSGGDNAKKDYIELMHGGDDWRAERIHGLLTERKSSQNQLFYHLQTLVMGANSGLVAAYANVSGGNDIFTDLAARLSHWQNYYIADCVRTGSVDFEGQLLLAMGVVTNTGCNVKEVEALIFHEDIPDTDKEVALTYHAATIQSLIGARRWDAFMARIEAAKHKELVESRISPSKGQRKRDRNETRRLADEEAAAIVRAYIKSSRTLGVRYRKVPKSKLAKDLLSWTKRTEDDARQYVRRPGTQFMAKIADAQVATSHFDKMLDADDVLYLLDIIDNATPVSDAFFDDGIDTNTLVGEGKKERKAERAQHGAKVGELEAKIDEKVRDHGGDTKFTNSKGIIKRIKGLSEDEKSWFVRSYLSPTEQQLWDDPTSDDTDRRTLHDQALLAIGADLKAAGLGHGDKGADVRDKLLKKLAYDYKKTNTLTRIKDYLKSDAPHTKAARYRGPALVGLIRKLRGDEFAHVRSNGEWMQDIEQTVDAKHWDLIKQLLGISDKDDTRDGVTGTKEVDLLHAQGPNGERKHTRDEARAIADKEAELKPSHWGAMLTAALKYCKHEPKRSEVNSIVTRAFMAAKRRERQTKGGAVAVSGDSALTAMSAADFMREVKATVSPGAMKIMETTKDRKLTGLKFGNALTALDNGTCPTVDEQIDDLKFVSPLKMTSGDRINSGKLDNIFDDLEGAKLLEEWSNIQEFKDLKERLDGTKSKRERRAIREQLRTFVIDIRADRHTDLKGMLSTNSLITTVGKLRGKLVDAMRGDPEVIRTLHDAGFDNDELAQSKTKTLALMDEQKARSSGAQYNTLPVGTSFITRGHVHETSVSTAPKESMGMVLGGTRKSEQELKDGHSRQQVIEDNQEDIDHAQKELARRGKDFDKVQKRFNMIISRVAKVLVGVLLGAAMTALTLLTGPIGGLAAVGLAALTMTLKQTALKGVQAALKGDRFNLTKSIWDVAFKVLVGAAVGVMGELAMPEVLAAVGQEITKTGNVLTETTTNVAPTTSAEFATESSLRFALGQGSKAILMSAIREARATDTNPATRQLLMAELGGILLGGGFVIANEVFAPVNEELQRDGVPGTGDDLGGKITDKIAQTGGKATTRVLTTGARLVRLSPKIRGLLQKLYLKKHKHGKDRSEDLTEIVPQVLANADAKIDDLSQQIRALRKEAKDGTERTPEETQQLEDAKQTLKAERDRIEQLRDALKAEYDAWQEWQVRVKGGDGSDANVMSVPVLSAALELDESLG